MLITVGLGIVLFLCFLFAYREGLRLGMRAAKGAEPLPIDPVKAFKEAQERKKEAEKAQVIEDEWETFEKFDGYTDAEREEYKRAVGDGKDG